MKTLIVSDLHSNDEALTTLLQRVRRKKFDRVFCLGDFVGYGAQPNQVLEKMRKLRGKKFFVRGNHDRVIAGLDDATAFNAAARAAALWTRDHLSSANRTFLKNLPLGPIMVDDQLMICHGSPIDEDQYLFSEADAYASLQRNPQASVIFFGHTHLPSVFALVGERRMTARIYRNDAIVKLDRSARYLINPGSVGQPRDRNPQASCAIYDSERHSIQFIRVDYDIASAQEPILRAGLPRILADRLSYGT
jgi:putative phosphoesterase